MRDGGWLPRDVRDAAHDRRAGERLRADGARIRGGMQTAHALGESARRTRAACACRARSATA